jgi:hypothetical protein
VVGIGTVSALGLVACGSSTKSAGKTTTTVTSSSTTAKSSQDIAADTAAAQAASLKLTDFPAGWTSQPQSNDTGPASLKSDLAKCLGVSEASLTNPPASVDSPDLSDSSNNNTASSTVGYRATAADQRASFALVSSTKVPNCLSSAVTSLINDEIEHPTGTDNTLPSGAKVGASTVSPMSFPQVGDSSVAYQVKVPISYQGLNVTAYLDLIFSIKGRADVEMSFEGVSDPFPTVQEQHYTELVVNRLTNT